MILFIWDKFENKNKLNNLLLKRITFKFPNPTEQKLMLLAKDNKNKIDASTLKCMLSL